MWSNTTHKETKYLLSVNRAADLLQKDRQTLVRALRHVPPDGYEGGQARWYMPTIRSALAMGPQARRESGKYRDRYSIGRNKPLDGLRLAIEKQVAEVSVERSLDKRRAMALALAPMLAEYQSLYLSAGRALGVADDPALGARSDLIWSEWADEVSEATEWPRNDGFSIAMTEAAWPNTDDDKAT